MAKPANVEDLYPLTPMQQGILFHSLQAGSAGVYFEQLVWSIEQPLDAEVFRAAWQQVMDRHSILRTSFLWEGLDEPVQVVHRRVEVSLELHDWQGADGGGLDSRLEELLESDRRRGFDVTRPPLVRLSLIRLARRRYRFIWAHHHLLLDGWSYPVILREVIEGYEAMAEGRAPRLERPRPFREFIAYLQGRDLAEAERYWRSALAGFGAPTPLGVDRLLPEALSRDERYDQVDLELSEADTDGLKSLAARHGLTLNSCVQGAWALLLSRYSGQADVVFGVIVSSRPPSLTGSDTMVGLFLNNVPLRIQVESEASLVPWLERLHERQFEVFHFEFCGLPRILEWSEVPRGQPLFESYLTFQNYPSTEFYRGHRGGLELRDLTFSIRTGYPLTVLAGLLPRFGVRITFDGRRFDRATCARMAGHLEALLAGLAAGAESGDEPRLAQLSLLRQAERHQLLAEWNDTQGASGEHPTLQAALAAQAAATPERVAVELGDGALSYGELRRRASHLAGELRASGVGTETLVAILLERSLEMIVGLVGVLAAGGAYLPLDPEDPRERLAFTLADAGAPLLLTLERHDPRLPAGPGRVVRLDADWPAVARRPALPPAAGAGANLAYVIYTSGSTGRPKGAMNSHRAVVNRLAWMQAAYRLTADDRVLQKTAYTFDVSVWELFWPLMTGARLVMARPGGHRDSAYLAHLVQERAVTVMHFVPSMLQLFLAEPAAGACASLRQVIASGEALSPELRDRFLDRLPAGLDNLYGPTEAAIDVSAWPCRRQRRGGKVPIGRPITNLRLHVLDESPAPVPSGVAGELHIGGAGLARGYLGRPGLTAERFVPDPLGNGPGERLYRTGDRARLLPGGSLEYLERIDHQVKVRGFRIELGEIESELRRHPAVLDAVVVAWEQRPGERRLVAYLTASEGGRPPAVEALRRFLARRLPDYMLPASVVALDALPLTTSGKVDRRALPAPGGARPDLEAAYEAPRSALERRLAEVWSEVLGVERVGVHDNFFALGGDSMRSLQVLAKARQRGVDFSLDRLVSRPTIAALARETSAGGGDRREIANPGAAAFSLISDADRRRLPPDLEDAYPLTRLQAGMLFHSGYTPGAATYHDVFSYQLAAPFDAGALDATLRRLMRRHPVLRTSFDLEGSEELLQRVHRECEPPLAVTDLRRLSAGEAEATIGRWIEEEKHRPFDWRRPPLFRVQVHRQHGSFRLSLSFLHAILDGWSVATLIGELGRVYQTHLRGRPAAAETAGPRTRFSDFVALERAAMESEACRSFWRGKLAALTDVRLPRAAPPTTVAGAGDRRDRRRPPRDLTPLLAGLQEVARRAGTPLKSVLLAAHLRVLSVLGPGPGAVTGLVLNNRPETPDSEQVLGLLLAVVPLRLGPVEGSWLDLVRATVEAEGELMPYRRYPLAEMLKLTAGVIPFEAVFDFTHFHVLDPERGGEGLEIAGRRFFEETNFSLMTNFSLNPESSRLTLGLEVDPEVVTPGQAAALEGYYRRTLEALASDPLAAVARSSPLGSGERHALLVEWNDTRLPVPRGTAIQEQWARQAAETPESPALICGDEVVSFRALERSANRLARHLAALGVGVETPVGIFHERSPGMVVAMLAILKAGGAYVPLDLGHPARRLAFMLEDAGAPVVVTRSASAAGLPRTAARQVRLDEEAAAIRRRRGDALPPQPGGDRLAYVIYTSGSTGRPKGVQVRHGGVVNFFLGMDRAVGCGPADTLLAVTSIGFDISVLELLWTLTRGARVLLAAEGPATSPGQRADAAALPELARRHRPTLLQCTPSGLQILAATAGGWPALSSLEALLVGGEALPETLARQAREALPGARLVNLYGPTETTIWSLTHRLDRTAGSVPIGRPIANTAVYLLDHRGRPVPPGVPGELVIGGDGLARGYHGRGGRTAVSFMPDPFAGRPGGRLYRTGDLARYRPGGEVEFLGRIDHQVKVRGFRIELGEIETALTSHPAVAEAAVLARPGSTGAIRLAAYVLPSAEGSSDADLVPALRRHLQGVLPDYMVPAAFVFLDAFPLNPNGKLDRRALPEPSGERPELAETFVAPRTPREETLAEVWRGVLGVERIGVYDSFLELGGDSILSIQIVARARAAGLRITPRQIFEGRTVAAVAAVAEATGESADAVVGEDGPAIGAVPLTPAQHWFFDLGLEQPRRFTQSLLLALHQRVDPALLDRVLAELLTHHDALRLRFDEGAAGWRALIAAPGAAVPVHRLDLAGLPEAKRPEAMARVLARLGDGLDLAREPLLRVALVDLGEGRRQRLFLLAHHLVVDGVSWRVLLEDMERLLAQARRGDPLELPPGSSSFKRYAGLLARHARSAEARAELPYWRQVVAGGSFRLPLDGPAGQAAAGGVESVRVRLGEGHTRALLQEVPAAYGTRVDEALLAALVEAFARWTGEPSLFLDLEGHGRGAGPGVVDLSRTVGWLTAIHPLRLVLDDRRPGEALKSVKEQVRRVPGQGLGFGLLRYLADDPGVARELARGRPEVAFSYLGRLDPALSTPLFAPVAEGAGAPGALSAVPLPHPLEIYAAVLGGGLDVVWSYRVGSLRRSTVETLAKGFLEALEAVISHCLSPDAGGYTPSDFPDVTLDASRLDSVLDELGVTPVED